MYCHWMNSWQVSFVYIYVAHAAHNAFSHMTAVAGRYVQALELIMQHNVHVMAYVVTVEKACLDYSCYFSCYNTSKQRSAMNCTSYKC